MATQHDIYRKTAKGSEAIATRQHGLSPRLRSLLILVDGKRNVDELRKLSGVNGDAEHFLGELLESGCIAPAAVANSPAAGATPGAAAPVPLAEASRQAVRRLTDMLGPYADDICMRLEAARSANEFHAALARAEELVRQLRGTAEAEAFAVQTTVWRTSRS